VILFLLLTDRKIIVGVGSVGEVQVGAVPEFLQELLRFCGVWKFVGVAGEEVVAAAHQLGDLPTGLILLVGWGLFGVARLHQSVLQSVLLLVAVFVQVVVALFLVEGQTAVLFVFFIVRQHLPDAGWQLEQRKSWKGRCRRRCMEGTSNRLFFKHSKQHLGVNIPILLPGEHINHRF
jgi:hypothetical protein